MHALEPSIVAAERRVIRARHVLERRVERLRVLLRLRLLTDGDPGIPEEQTGERQIDVRRRQIVIK